MNAQAILQKIEDDANQAAAQARAEAEQKAADMLADTNQKLQQMHDEVVQRANAECDELAKRMKRMAELDDRKQLLQAKRVVMDEAFAQAKDKLRQTTAKEARAFLLQQTAQAAQGGEQLIVGANNADWFDPSFVDELNAVLKAAGKPADITLSQEKREGMTGAVLKHSGTEVFCTFESLLESVRAELETDVASILFND